MPMPLPGRNENDIPRRHLMLHLIIGHDPLAMGDDKDLFGGVPMPPISGSISKRDGSDTE